MPLPVLLSGSSRLKSVPSFEPSRLPAMPSDETSRLIETALRIKKRFLKMYRDANAGHVGSALSVAEILTFVRFGWMVEGDEIILSKGHAAAALYAMLAEEGDRTSQTAPCDMRALGVG